MIALLGIIYWVVIALALVVVSEKICATAPGLRPWRSTIKTLALFWCVAAVAKWHFIDAIIPPADALHHKSLGWDIADALWVGDYEPFIDSCRPGNPAYRAMLGLFYAVTSAPEVIVYTLNAALAFTGLLTLLKILSLHTSAKKAPAVAVLGCLLIPSGLVWTTTNLKEGLVLWGGCMLLYWTLQSTPRASKKWPRLGLVVLGLLRPHVAVMWTVAIGIAAVIKSGRYRLGISAAVGVVICAMGLKLAAPDLFDAAFQVGITESLGERQAAVEGEHGGASLNSADRVLVYTGVTLIMFRPWPTEASTLLEIFAGAEAWFFAFAGLLCWRNPVFFAKAVSKNGCLLAMVLALLCFGFYFSFMYNMGLAVRQRLMVFPALLFLYFWPAFVARAPGSMRVRHSSVSRGMRTPFRPNAGLARAARSA